MAVYVKGSRRAKAYVRRAPLHKVSSLVLMKKTKFLESRIQKAMVKEGIPTWDRSGRSSSQRYRDLMHRQGIVGKYNARAQQSAHVKYQKGRNTRPTRRGVPLYQGRFGFVGEGIGPAPKRRRR